MISGGVLDELTGAIGDIDRASIESCSGGSINRCYSLRTIAGKRYFLKINSERRTRALNMFEAEFAGLEELAAAHCVRVPQPIAVGACDQVAWLLLEFLPLGGHSESAGVRLGSLLARQHRKNASSYGWSRDNTIGSTQQINEKSSDWLAFYRMHRLAYQFGLAKKNGLGASLQSDAQRLLNSLPVFFDGYHPEPSLLHGDLWGGNWGVTTEGEPVCFDPAVYYGDREADIAMTRLFGGFGPDFYAAYNNEWPLDPGFESRCDLYNLYHVLNHLNLFGRGYLAQAESMLKALLQHV